MTQQDIQLIIDLWNNYVPISTIIKMLPYKVSDAKKMIAELRQNGTLKPRNENRKENTRQRVLDLFNGGILSEYEIADKLGLSRYTVRNILVDEKLNRERPKQNYNKRKLTQVNTLCEKTQTIVNDLIANKDIRDIIIEHNVSRQYVYSIKKKYLAK